MDELTIKRSKVLNQVPTVNQLDGYNFAWNSRNRVFYGLALNKDGSRQVVPIGGAVQGNVVEGGSFKGTCDLLTDPGTPTADEWWSATEVGIYTNFGSVEVTSLVEVFNYIKWDNSTSTWTIEIVPINFALAQIPKVVDGVWDLNVSKSLEIEVKPYLAKKLSDPSFPYFYLGTTSPTFHSRLNLDGDLHVTKLFAGAVNMVNGTALKWLTLDSSNNIVCSDAPAGGVTPGDYTFQWDAANSRYAPFTAKKAINPGYPYFFTHATDGCTYTHILKLDGTLYLSALQSAGVILGNPINSNSYFSGVTYLQLANFVNPVAYYNRFDNNTTIHSTDIYAYTSQTPAITNPIRMGDPLVKRNGEYISADDYNQRFDINFTKTRFNKGTALKWLVTDANKEVAYVDNTLERIFNIKSVTAGDTIYLDPKVGYAYAIAGIWIQTNGDTSNVNFWKNATEYAAVNIAGTGQELTTITYIPTTAAVGDVIKLVVDNNVTQLMIRIKMIRTQ